jgi:quercetin dioxygenase-like cupin family protein
MLSNLRGGSAGLAFPDMSAFDDLARLGPLPIWEGIVARAVSGEELTLAVVELDPGAIAREHSHANEQLGIVLTGSMTFRVGDETRELGPGGTWTIPGNTPHEAIAGPEGAVVIDVFAPPRADWSELEPGAERQPRWP